MRAQEIVMCNGSDKKGKISHKIIENVKIATDIYRMTITGEGISNLSKPGQFLNLYCKQNSMILPRPISISEVDLESDTITLVYGVVGKGTKEFSTLVPGDSIEVLGPLGNGFNIDKDVQRHILIGGGIGIPPLVELSKNLKGNIEVYLGFRSEPYLIDEFESLGAKVFISTDDGSKGLKGTVVDLLNQKDTKGQMIYACGPKPMLQAVSFWAKDRSIPAQISMEERMGCGTGACVGCVVKIKNDHSWEYKKVCKDGPVFNSQEVVWDA